MDALSGAVLYDISDETKHKLSGQSIHQISDTATARSIGTIAFTSDPSENVAAILHGKDMLLRRESATSSRWLFRPSSISFARTKKGLSWYWRYDKARAGIVLADGKRNGVVIARMQRDLLAFDKPGLAHDTVVEICVAAVALAELARRHRQPQQGSDLAASIAQVALGETFGYRDVASLDKSSRMRKRLALALR